MIRRSNQPLNVEITPDGLLSITIGTQILKDLLEVDLECIEVTSSEGFARDVLYSLEEEFSDGTTLVHQMLDQAAKNAIEYSDYVKVVEG